VVRRLLLKNRDVGLFCNLSITTLTGGGFPELFEFLDANRAIAPSLVFEFTQSAVRAMGPAEHDNLAALAERGFRFSMDNLVDLAVEPRELTDRGFRFIKVPAELLLSRIGGSGNIHPADFSELLGRFGIDLIAERVESETRVVELLDYDVRFGQGFLFSPPRPVRQDALVNTAAVNVAAEPAKSAADKLEAAVNELAAAGAAAKDGNGAADLRAGGGGLS
jgi:cyclic-di-GMP phosphodiesterase, flagellum assembly factor TipF